ncbi:MAG: hypothetical protein GY946_27935, partial [bacterium]|nr:hypothetical protein [bacterium]
MTNPQGGPVQTIFSPRSLLLVLAFIGICATPGSAGDGDDARNKWIVQCIEALRSDDNATRTGAEATLSTLGAAAMPAILPELERLQTDRDWQALVCALNGMGPKAAVLALRQHAALFPKSLKERFCPLHGSLDSEKPPGEPGVSEKTPQTSLL